MPRNVRNFWIEGEVDGVKTPIATGPKAKGGGFSLDIKQRANGCVTDAVSVRGCVDDSGLLDLYVFDHNGEPVIKIRSHRDRNVVDADHGREVRYYSPMPAMKSLDQAKPRAAAIAAAMGGQDMASVNRALAGTGWQITNEEGESD